MITYLSLNHVLLLQRSGLRSTTLVQRGSADGFLGAPKSELTGRCVQKWSLTPESLLITSPTLFTVYIGARRANPDG